MTGLVFDIQRCCIHDGPGIRTTVFLKGCPLRCPWCHNPESKRFHPELFFTPNLCIDCKACAKVCPNGDARGVLTKRISGTSRCKLCLQCASACPSGAIEVVGKEMTVEAVMAEVEKDRVFYEESGGGMTVSGGEPMAQFPFTHELVQAAHARGFHTCIETCGYAPAEHYEAIVPSVDLFLWDVKDTDAERHERSTGAPLSPILDNLRRVDALGAKTILRCVLIQGINFDAEHLARIAALFKELRNASGVELLPYHPLGVSKRERLGIAAPPEEGAPPTPEDIAAARAWLANEGVPM